MNNIPDTQSQTHQTNSDNGWKSNALDRLVAFVDALLKTQKHYGSSPDARSIMQALKLKMSPYYSVEEVIWALDQYTNKHDDFPAPANLIQELQPKEAKVTHAEYVNAMMAQERNGFPEFSYEAYVIADYKRQQEEERSNVSAHNEEIRKLAENAGRRLDESGGHEDQLTDER